MAGRDHDHHHRHVHSRPAAAAPTMSLLRLSAAARLGGVAVLLALLWASVFWAMG